MMSQQVAPLSICGVLVIDRDVEQIMVEPRELLIMTKCAGVNKCQRTDMTSIERSLEENVHTLFFGVSPSAKAKCA